MNDYRQATHKEQADFRLRKVPNGYRVSQRVGSGWELLSTVYPTKADAVSYIRAILGGAR